MPTRADRSGLDNPVHSSLTGLHSYASRHLGRAAAYRADFATFCSVPADPTAADWSDLAQLLGSGSLADLFDCPHPPPPHWKSVFAVDGLQMITTQTPDADVTAPPTPPEGVEVVELGPTDRPHMLELAEQARPGPFYPRTPELGTYLGIRRHGTLLAMAGERLHPPGWTEISAVCTAPEARGHGYASHLVQALTARISARGEGTFLHVLRENTNAIELYTRLGFQPRRTVRFQGFEIP